MNDGDVKLTPEIKREIDEIESSDFYLQMKDHWSNDDFRIHETYQKRIRELREKLKEMEEKKDEI